MRTSLLTLLFVALIFATATLAHAESSESQLICTPGSDPDWTTQGNNFARTNSTTASLSSLCGITQAWSTDLYSNNDVVQPVIAGDRVLVMDLDTLRCFDKNTGAQLWVFGGWPYVVTSQAVPTVDVTDSAVYVAGGGIRSFSKIDLTTGTVIWSRNNGGIDPPLDDPNGWLRQTPSVLVGGHIFFSQHTGTVTKLDAATGATAGHVTLPDAPSVTPLNALTSDGTKLWVGTGYFGVTDGSIHQIDMSTMTVDWSLANPSGVFWGDTELYGPESFLGSMAYEDNVLYYHSAVGIVVREPAHYQAQTAAVGAIDVTVENGTGIGILWVNDAQSATVASPLRIRASYENVEIAHSSGPAIGPSMVYLTSFGRSNTPDEQDGVSAWDKTLGTRVWYSGYDTKVGRLKGIDIFEDVRSASPATVFCQPDGTPHVLTGHASGLWRLYDGNTGAVLWKRHMTGPTGGTAVSDDCLAVIVRNGGLSTGGGSLVVFTVQGDRPRICIDSQVVSVASFPSDGAQSYTITNAITNTGCVDLQITAYTPQAPSDPLFVTAVSGPSTLAPGASGTITLTYDATGLTPYVNYTNYIGFTTDDPDYYPQDPTGATLGQPMLGVNLSSGCLEESVRLPLGQGQEWITNYGLLAYSESSCPNPDVVGAPSRESFSVGASRYQFAGSMWLVAQDSLHWAIDNMLIRSPCCAFGIAGCVESGGKTQEEDGPSEFAPEAPCELNSASGSVANPIGGSDPYESVSYRMIDAGSNRGYFAAGSRQCFGVVLDIQHVGATDAAFGDFSLVRVNITNDSDGQGDISDLYFGVAQDWDIPPAWRNNTNLNLIDGSYSCDNGGSGGRAAATAACGNARLDAPAVGTARVGTLPRGFHDFFGAAQLGRMGAFRIASDPYNYEHPEGFYPEPNDMGVFMSIAHVPFLAEDSSAEFFYCTWQLDNGVNGLPWSDSASYDAAVNEIVCRAKAYAGFGKGDVNCDGVIDLADVVLLGNIVDGLTTPTGGGIYTADVDADLDYDEADYDLLFDVVSGEQPASAMGNAWRF